jgi:hypothetical protein
MSRIRWAPVRRFVWETLAVLSGILIAFGLDAWWDTHQDRDELRESLSAVHAEFSDSRAQLDSVMAVNGAAIDGTDAFLGMTAEEISRLDPADARTLFRALMRADTFDPAASAIDAVISANVLERIDKLQLRSALSAWSGGVSDLVEEQAEVRRVEGALRDLLAREGIADPVISTQIATLDGHPIDPRPALLALRRSAGACQLLLARGADIRLMLGEQRGLSRRIDEILATLAAQLR